MTISGQPETENDKHWILFTHKGEKRFSVQNSVNEDEEKKKKEEMYSTIQEDLKQALLSENLIVLAGAGASFGDKGGKLMKGLWDAVKSQINGEFEAILTIASYAGQNLEELLSRLQTAKRSAEDQGKDTGVIVRHVETIEKIIVDECRFSLPSEFPHKSFLKKLIQSRKKTSPRLKVFTLNYDECFEQAADEIGAVIIDGFSFSQKGEFRSVDFDLDIVQREQTRIHNEENFYKKVLHLYKLHGSVSWERPFSLDGKITKKEKPASPLLIYPNSSKYEESYNMPFFEMIARFQAAIRSQNTTLFILGYSFSDAHINRIVKEALRINDSLHVFVVSANIKESVSFPEGLREELFRFIENGHSGITLLADTFLNFEKNLPEIKYPDIEEERQRQLSLQLPPPLSDCR